MAIILRIDVDSPYGKKRILHHIFSRLTSDLNLAPIIKLPYLKDLNYFISYLNKKAHKGYFFFRKCTLPNTEVLENLKKGGHRIGLHLENSRSIETFNAELKLIKEKLNSKIEVFTKHGSGKHKYGLHHYAPYEPEKYLMWGTELGMKLFLGNLEDPSIPNYRTHDGLLYFPAAFWLEHYWRNTSVFDINWLIKESKEKDIVLLLHAENVVHNTLFFDELELILQNTETKIL